MELRHDLVIADASLRDFGGHAYFYDTTVAQAAGKYFDSVQIYAHPAFFAHSREPGLRALKLPPGYSALERTNARINAADAGSAPRDGLVARARRSLKRAAKVFGALFYLFHVLREGVRDGQRRVVFLQYVTPAELQAVNVALAFLGWLPRDSVRFAIVIRYAPKIFLRGPPDAALFRRLLADPRVAVFTDSDPLTRAYRQEFASDRVQTLPVPVSAAVATAAGHARQPGPARIGFLGATREEKGFAGLPGIVRATAAHFEGRHERLLFVVQVNTDSPKNLFEPVAELEALQRTPLGAVSVSILRGPLDTSAYVDVLRGLDVMLIPYQSGKYQHSTSGIFAECLHAGVPCICFEDTWAGQLIRDAASQGLRIGETVRSLGEMPMAIDRLLREQDACRSDLASYARQWRTQHSGEEIARLLRAIF